MERDVTITLTKSRWLMIIGALAKFQESTRKRTDAVDLESIEKTKAECETKIVEAVRERKYSDDVGSLYKLVQDKVYGFDKIKQDRTEKNEADESFF